MNKTPEQIALAWQVMDLIDKFPEKHDQDRWMNTTAMPVWESGLDLDEFLSPEMSACGTTACFAGWTAMVTGARILGGAVRMPSSAKIRSGSGWGSLPTYAAQALGLGESTESGDYSWWAMDYLFAGEITLEQLRERVTEIFGPRPTGTLDGAR